jgi:2-keto-3-deoxy-L-rhamnonate aldolase RhmA
VLRQHDHPIVRGAIDKILNAASARGVAVCTGVTLPLEQQHECIARGARLALLTSDVELLAGGAAVALAAARTALA